MRELKQIVSRLEEEAARTQKQQRPLQADEIERVRTIYESIPLLNEAIELLRPDKAPAFITYKIVSDLDGRLKAAARIACNFWNRFVEPNGPIVIRLETYNAPLSPTIARAYKPYSRNGVMYGRVEFNLKFLRRYSETSIAGTIVHEIGHTLGFGWETWDALYSRTTGQFNQDAVDRLGSLGQMLVELDYGSGTRHSHWDEETFDRELMTGFKDRGEHVLPVTIDVMELLGHTVIERLEGRTDLDDLLELLAHVQFSRREEARAIDRDYFEETDLLEVVPHDRGDAKPDPPHSPNGES